MSKPHTLNKRYPKPNNSTDNRIIHKFKLQKPIYGTIDRFEGVAYNRRMKPIVAFRMQRRKPRYIGMGIMPIKKNPNKVILYAEKGSAFKLQVFYYIDRPSWVCIAAHGDFMQIPDELVRSVIRGLRAYLKITKESGIIHYSSYQSTLRRRRQ